MNDEIPPFKPDYNLIEKQPRDWSAIALLIAFFGIIILLLATYK